MKARIIAYYLPQYHPIPENDKYWGKGFTEWPNVVQARPLFRGHKQPHIPADLGFYDLRLPEVREEQAQLARKAGIEGFMYWHYWFGGGKELLERPFNEVVNSGKPAFPFCLGWANHDWSTKSWTVNKNFKNVMIAKQTYPGDEDIILHFNTYLKAFRDPRYIKVDGRLLFVVFKPLDVPNMKRHIELWQQRLKRMDSTVFILSVFTVQGERPNNNFWTWALMPAISANCGKPRLTASGTSGCVAFAICCVSAG